jgi:hypothetical protein
MRKKMFWLIGGVVLTAATLWGPIVGDVEQAKYEVIEAQGAIEIRDYASHIVAEVEVQGERKEAISQGFRLIAGYIFGGNVSAQKVAMTAPVIQQSNEKIAMTAPVIQQGEGTNWKVQFVMPSEYTMETLPKPTATEVKLTQVEGKRFAAIRFSGTGSEENLKENTQDLLNFVESKQLKMQSLPSYAFYNPPWTLPFLRRNEVMVEVQK